MRGEPIQPLPKPTRRSMLTRDQCVDAIYKRAGGRCERCGQPVRRAGHVNERVPRSRGGDPCDPANCELVCYSCHFPGGAHAPTIERQRRLLDGKVFLG